MSSQFTRGVKGDFPTSAVSIQANAALVIRVEQTGLVHCFELLIPDLDNVKEHIALAWAARRDLDAPLPHQGQALGRQAIGGYVPIAAGSSEFVAGTSY